MQLEDLAVGVSEATGDGVKTFDTGYRDVEMNWSYGKNHYHDAYEQNSKVVVEVVHPPKEKRKTGYEWFSSLTTTNDISVSEVYKIIDEYRNAFLVKPLFDAKRSLTSLHYSQRKKNVKESSEEFGRKWMDCATETEATPKILEKENGASLTRASIKPWMIFQHIHNQLEEDERNKATGQEIYDAAAYGMAKELYGNKNIRTLKRIILGPRDKYTKEHRSLRKKVKNAVTLGVDRNNIPYWESVREELRKEFAAETSCFHILFPKSDDINFVVQVVIDGIQKIIERKQNKKSTQVSASTEAREESHGKVSSTPQKEITMDERHKIVDHMISSNFVSSTLQGNSPGKLFEDRARLRQKIEDITSAVDEKTMLLFFDKLYASPQLLMTEDGQSLRASGAPYKIAQKMAEKNPDLGGNLIRNLVRIQDDQERKKVARMLGLFLSQKNEVIRSVKASKHFINTATSLKTGYLRRWYERITGDPDYAPIKKLIEGVGSQPTS